MRFSVRHETIYRYSAPVRFAEHVIRLNPRPDSGVFLSQSLIIEPTPSWLLDETDEFGNRITCARFGGESDVLRIESRFELDTVISPLSASGSLSILPLSHEASGANVAYLGGHAHATVRNLAADVASACAGDALKFLDGLNQELFNTIRHDIRAEGAARHPEETLALGHGACRDVTTVFIAACRSLGLPARFVSGYQAQAVTPDGRRHLHAWPEAFVPGAGWRGYDPTHGLAVTDGHIALCAAPEQTATMPVEGGFYGVGVASQLSYSVEIATSTN